MPNWNEILDEIKEAGSICDVIRRKYLRQLHERTGRNVIIYYSGWLQKSGIPTRACLGGALPDGYHRWPVN